VRFRRNEVRDIRGTARNPARNSRAAVNSGRSASVATIAAAHPQRPNGRRPSSRQTTKEVSGREGDTQDHERSFTHVSAARLEQHVLLLLQLIGTLHHPFCCGRRSARDLVHRLVGGLRHAVNDWRSLVRSLPRDIVYDLMSLIRLAVDGGSGKFHC
jgi:hypothetical protein